MSEQHARRKFPHLVVASLGEIRKDKPDGIVTAMFLFDALVARVTDWPTTTGKGEEAGKRDGETSLLSLPRCRQ